MLKLKNIRKTYGVPGSSAKRVVLDSVNLEVHRGDSVAVVGPSGCGKSTLLNIIGALDTPDCGSVYYEGKDITQMNETGLSQLRNKRIGFVFQLHHLLPQCTVLENVLIPTLAGGSGADDGQVARALELLAMVGLTEFRDYTPGRLSGGQRQRAAVARALINEPDLLLADEPTGSLDLNTADLIISLLNDINQQSNVTVVVVTHAARLAEQMSRRFSLTGGVLAEGVDTC